MSKVGFWGITVLFLYEMRGHLGLGKMGNITLESSTMYLTLPVLFY